jgi:hypothetical protein
MSEPGAPLTRFDIASGELRGSQLSLYATCLVHRGGAHLETMPLAMLAAVRVEFLRDQRRLGWGVGWLLIALVLIGLAAPLGALAHAAVQELSAQPGGGGGGVAAALLAFFRFLEALARALPLAAAVAAAGGAALCALGWIGGTTLTVAFAGGERAFRVRGRNTLLLDFSERLSEQIMALKR